MTSADSVTHIGTDVIQIVSGVLGSAQRKASSVHRFSAATRVESVAPGNRGKTPSQFSFSFLILGRFDIKKA